MQSRMEGDKTGFVVNFPESRFQISEIRIQFAKSHRNLPFLNADHTQLGRLGTFGEVENKSVLCGADSLLKSPTAAYASLDF